MKRRLLLISLILIIIFLIIFIIYYRVEKKNSEKFLMYIEDVYTIDDEIYLTGIVETGSVKINNKLEIIQHGKYEVTVKEILDNNKNVNEYKSNGRIAINVGKIDKDDFKRGSVLAAKGLITETENVKMKITINDTADLQIQKGTTLVFKIGNENYVGVVDMKDSLVATQTGVINVTFDDKVPVYKNIKVIIKTDGLTEIGKGKITEVK